MKEFTPALKVNGCRRRCLSQGQRTCQCRQSWKKTPNSPEALTWRFAGHRIHARPSAADSTTLVGEHPCHVKCRRIECAVRMVHPLGTIGNVRKTPETKRTLAGRAHGMALCGPPMPAAPFHARPGGDMPGIACPCGFQAMCLERLVVSPRHPHGSGEGLCRESASRVESRDSQGVFRLQIFELGTRRFESSRFT